VRLGQHRRQWKLQVALLRQHPPTATAVFETGENEMIRIGKFGSLQRARTSLEATGSCAGGSEAVVAIMKFVTESHTN
jgi:hypothetical protein